MGIEQFKKNGEETFYRLQKLATKNIIVKSDTHYFENENQIQILIELIDKTKINEDKYGIVGSITGIITANNSFDEITVEIMESDGYIFAKTVFNSDYVEEMFNEYLPLFEQYMGKLMRLNYS